MGEHGRMPADGDLSARIEAALHSDLDTRPVDVGHLATSTRIGIRRARLRRRIAGTGALVAAVAAVAVVVATGNGSALGTRTVQPANSRVTPTTTSAPRLSRVTAADFTFPESMGLSPSDFPNPRMRLQPGTPPVDPYQPTVFGQTCPWDGTRTLPVPGQLKSRAWGWDEGDTSLPTQQLRVEITATLWKAGTGQKHFDEILTNTGYCQWRVGVPRAASTGSLPGTSWVATRGIESAEAAMLIGDVIVGIDVADPKGHASALQVARRLLALSVGRLEAASLVVTSSSTCTPACQTGPTNTCTGACAVPPTSTGPSTSPAASFAPFAGQWTGHTRFVTVSRSGRLQEHIGDGCCDPVIDMVLQLSNPHRVGGTWVATSRVVSANVHPGWRNVGLPAPKPGDKSTVTIGADNVLVDSFTDNRFCADKASPNTCGA